MIHIRCLGNKIYYIVFFLLLYIHTVIAQTTPPKLFEILTVQEIENQLRKNEISKPKAAQELVVLGEYEKADRLIGKENLIHITNDSTFEIKNLLKDSIRIAIFNESHHIPQHRKFLADNLKKLYNAGFKYLALETLTNDFRDSLGLRFDDDLLERRFPYFSQITGIYSKEPEYGKLIREAISCGFELVAYEKIGSGNRELIQAKNIVAKTFAIDEYAKVVILCGYHHIFEESEGKNKMMAEYLKEMSGYNPITFYQLNAIDRKLENKYCNHIPLILPSIDNKFYYDSTDITNKCDYFIYHFNPSYYMGIPDWKLNMDIHELINITQYVINFGESRIKFPILVRIYSYNEPDSATPLEIMQINNEIIPKFTSLEKETLYRLVIIDSENNKFEILIE